MTNLKLSAFATWAFAQSLTDEEKLFDGIENSYARVFGTDEGKKVLAHLIVSEGFLLSSFVPGLETNEVLFRDGRKSLIGSILQTIAISDQNNIIKALEEKED